MRQLAALFFPDEYAESIRSVDYDAMYARGIRGLIFDIDNTIEGYDVAVPSEESAAFLLLLKNKGFSVCFASNNSRERVERFNERLNFPALYKAGKPSRNAMSRAVALMNVDAGAAAVIGDQIFTDIWCGKRFGAYTVLVRPVTDYDPWNVKLKRLLERLMFAGKNPFHS